MIRHVHLSEFSEAWRKRSNSRSKEEIIGVSSGHIVRDTGEVHNYFEAPAGGFFFVSETSYSFA